MLALALMSVLTLFLSYFSPSLYQYEYENGSETIVAALSLATMWSFSDLKDRLVQSLIDFKCPPVRFLELSRLYDFKLGVKQALLELIHRREYPSKEEIEKLGMDYYYRISGCREKGRDLLLHVVAQADNGNIVRNLSSIIDSQRGYGRGPRSTPFSPETGLFFLALNTTVFDDCFDENL